MRMSALPPPLGSINKVGSSKHKSWFCFDDRIDGGWSKQFHPGFHETSLGQTPQKNPAKERSSTELRFASFLAPLCGVVYLHFCLTTPPLLQSGFYQQLRLYSYRASSRRSKVVLFIASSCKSPFHRSTGCESQGQLIRLPSVGDATPGLQAASTATRSSVVAFAFSTYSSAPRASAALLISSSFS